MIPVRSASVDGSLDVCRVVAAASNRADGRAALCRPVRDAPDRLQPGDLPVGVGVAIGGKKAVGRIEITCGSGEYGERRKGWNRQASENECQ